MIKICGILILLMPFACAGQFTISGRVLNQADKKAIPNVSVFIANATIGSKSADDGIFFLKNIKPGKYELIISVLGFETYHQNLMLTEGNIVLPDILMLPKIKELQEVSIKFDKYRERNLGWFMDEFLGTSGLAKECKLLNPEILNLDYDDATGTLTASSDDYLKIENYALGYRIDYLLANFTLNNKDENAKTFHYNGSIFFREMEGTSEQEQNWIKRRQEVYENSFMHFLRSAIDDRIEEEGFGAYRISIVANPQRPGDDVISARIAFYKDIKNRSVQQRDSLSYWIKKSKLPGTIQTLVRSPLAKIDIVAPTGHTGIYSLGCDNDVLYITYNKYHQFHLNANINAPGPETTIVKFKVTPALFDGNGGLIDTKDLEFTGAWAGKRIAEVLPLDYEPEDAKVDYTVSKNLTEKLKGFSDKHVTEKAYLHFDKPYYAASDTIYFKAYVTTGNDSQLSSLSGVLHVDLVNTNSKIDQSIILQVNNGIAWGEFALPDSLPNGNYKVRAYTQLMQNNQNQGVFTRSIAVISVKDIREPDFGTKTLVKNLSNETDVQFFPEGGNLVAGVRSKVAFKAIDRNGLGVSVKGVVLDNGGREICAFASGHLGMGYFYIQSFGDKTYKAKISYADGTQNIIDLPTADLKGITLSVNNSSPSKAIVTINSNKDFYHDNQGKDFTLFVCSGNDVASFVCKLNNPSVSINIEKNQLRTGVARLTLFSPNGEPLGERLLFIKNHDLLNLQISSDKTGYLKREKVKINLNAADDNGRPIKGHFSVSVIDDSQVPVDENSEHTILTDLLLTSDLKGYVEQPNYYFTAEPGEALNNLDVLMLTQGYRRFEWKQVLGYKVNQGPAFQPETSLELTGILKTPAEKPISNGKVIFMDGKDNIIRDVTTDVNGGFKFSNLYITDTTMVVLSAKKGNNDADVKLEIKQPIPLPLNLTDTVNEIRIVPQTVALMQQKYRYVKTVLNLNGIKLNPVTIKGSRAHLPKLQHSSNINRPGNNDFVIMGDQLTNCTGLPCLFGKLPGTISKGGALYLIRTGDRLGEHMGYPPPKIAFILDGVLLPDQSYVFDMVNLSDIYSVELLKSGAYLALYGTSAPGGALVFTTKRGGEYKNKPIVSPGLIRFSFKGFYKSKEFYSPKYEHQGDNNDQKDLRSTICWIPELVTDKNGRVSFEYYNADGHGAYRIIIEGIGDTGNIGRQLYRYKGD